MKIVGVYAADDMGSQGSYDLANGLGNNRLEKSSVNLIKPDSMPALPLLPLRGILRVDRSTPLAADGKRLVKAHITSLPRG